MYQLFTVTHQGINKPVSFPLNKTGENGGGHLVDHNAWLLDYIQLHSVYITRCFDIEFIHIWCISSFGSSQDSNKGIQPYFLFCFCQPIHKQEQLQDHMWLADLEISNQPTKGT